MKRKYLIYAALPAFAVALAVGGVASAHGLFGGFGFGGMSNLTPDQIATNQQNMFQREADLLGISVDEVKTAWASGKSFQQLATEKGINRDQLRQKMQALAQQDAKNYLDTLVSKGVITQSQADQRLRFINSQTASSTTSTGRGFGRRGRGMGMGFRPGWGF